MTEDINEIMIKYASYVRRNYIPIGWAKSREEKLISLAISLGDTNDTEDDIYRTAGLEKLK